VAAHAAAARGVGGVGRRRARAVRAWVRARLGDALAVAVVHVVVGHGVDDAGPREQRQRRRRVHGGSHGAGRARGLRSARWPWRERHGHTRPVFIADHAPNSPSGQRLQNPFFFWNGKKNDYKILLLQIRITNRSFYQSAQISYLIFSVYT